jgi:hypothetical protein
MLPVYVRPRCVGLESGQHERNCRVRLGCEFPLHRGLLRQPSQQDFPESRGPVTEVRVRLGMRW